MREQHQQAKREKGRREESEGGSGGEAGKPKRKMKWEITMLDVRGEMKPFVNMRMD